MPYHVLEAVEVDGFIAAHDPLILDMRDPASRARGTIAGAEVITDELIAALRRSRAFERPILIYCYHGISSHDMAAFFAGLGFRQVYNLTGGWAAWEASRPVAQDTASPLLARWYAARGFAPGTPAARIARGMTPLMQASLAGEVAIVEELLGFEACRHLTNDDGNTALWFACKGDHTEVMRRLLQAGLDPDHQNPEGVTCLIYAASAGKLAVVRTLLEAGADQSLATLDGFTALDCAATLPVLRLLRE